MKYMVCKFSKRIEGGLGTCSWILHCIEKNVQMLAEEFEKTKKVAEGYWEQALPFMERALELEPDDTNVLESLKGLYYRFDRMDKYNEIKAKIEGSEEN